MDTIRGQGCWWWLDEHRAWRRTRTRAWAWWRAHCARRAELRATVYGWDIVGGKWR